MCRSANYYSVPVPLVTGYCRRSIGIGSKYYRTYTIKTKIRIIPGDCWLIGNWIDGKSHLRGKALAKQSCEGFIVYPEIITSHCCLDGSIGYSCTEKCGKQLICIPADSSDRRTCNS